LEVELMSNAFCSQCGHQNTDEANFCSSCGQSLLSVGEDLTVTLHTTLPDGALVDVTLDGTAGSAPAALVINRGPDSGQVYLLDREVVVAGRNPDAEIFLDDVTVSRRHAEIRRAGNSYTLVDSGSLNGTYVNTHRVGEQVLQAGDEVQIGKFHLVFLSAERSPAEPAQASPRA
jgi:Inner membrane component of T3SS, cytoplasmic domain/zinc-ribbon domain